MPRTPQTPEQLAERIESVRRRPTAVERFVEAAYPPDAEAQKLLQRAIKGEDIGRDNPSARPAVVPSRTGSTLDIWRSGTPAAATAWPSIGLRATAVPEGSRNANEVTSAAPRRRGRRRAA